MARRRWFRSRALDFAAEVAAGPTFTVTPTDATGVDVDPAVFGLTAYADPVAMAPRVSRATALQVPAVKRARDLICGAGGQLPLELYGPDGTRRYSQLFAQPEKSTPRSVTITRTLEDLFFESVAWWLVTAYGWHGYPVEVVRLDPTTVDVTAEGRVYTTAAGHHGTVVQWLEDKDLIRFDSPNAGILTAGARAIRTALNLDAAAARYADEPMPMGYFAPADGTDPADDDEVTDLLNAWATARRTRATGYVPAALKYEAVQFNAEQMQLAEQRQHAVLEIARLTGVNPEDLGVSTTSRTYFNAFDKRKDFLDFTLGNYRQAFEDRLSMGDVTPRGYAARVNTDAFLRSDPATRYAAYAAGKAVGVLTDADIAAAEGKNPNALTGTTDQPAAPVEEPPVTSPAPAAALEPGPSFTDHTGPAIRLDAAGAHAFEVDATRRTITGLAVPYGVSARSGGELFQFAPGTLTYADVSRVKLWIQHNPDAAVGVATALEDTDAGLVATFRVARGPEGDRALSMAEDGVWDGLSVGLAPGGQFETRDGINHAVSVPLMEISLTPAPAFDDARVHAVAASATTTTPEGTTTMDDETTANGTAAPAASSNTAPLDFAAIGQAVAAAMAATPSSPAAPSSLAAPAVPARETVPAAPAFAQVNEGPLYRFDGGRGRHDFSTDLINGLKFGDGEAMARVNGFVADAFAPKFVTSTNVAALNPARNRPDLYVDQLDYPTPLYAALNKGGLTDSTPFVVPKFGTSAGLVGDHTEGEEPDAGSFTATAQTITPAPVSGKAEIPREVIDAGGNPQVSALIWNQIQRAYFEMLEGKAATLLAGQTYDAAHTIALTGTDEALVGDLKAKLAALQFIRGGNRFRVAPMHKALYTALTGAQDASGRPLLPIIAPQNSDGTTAAGLEYVDVAGVRGTASWALENLGTPVSFLANPDDAHVWASAPQRLSFEYRVAYVDLAVWGYVATAVTRIDGLRKVTYAAS